jgi:hypothetical protein
MSLKAFCVSFVSVCASFALAGCGGAPSVPAGQGASAPRWQTSGIAHSACSQVAAGVPTCLARKVDEGVQPACGGPQCWLGPADFQAHYELPVNKGAGQIVAVIDAGDNPKVASDLATYRTQFGLGTANFFKYNQEGQQSNYPTYTGWELQIDLDTEMVSATCPKCTIYLVEANTSAGSDLGAAEVEAVKLGAHIISNGWGCAGSTCVNEKDFDKPGVTYLAAASDSGFGVSAPASFDSVAAIGATHLVKSGSTYTETVSTLSTGGCATGITKPKWQSVIPDSVCPYRITNDAAVEADCSPGVSECGTGVASPLLAGVFGLAGNATKQHGGRTFWVAAHRKHLYDLSGSCTYRQGQYTTCSGWGSPKGIGAF